MTKELGSKISAGRKAVGLTQEELADLLGVTPGAVSNWERGERKPRDLDIYRKLAEIIGSPVQDLILDVEQKRDDASFTREGGVGKAVPRVAPDRVADYLSSGDSTIADGDARPHFPCGSNSFQTIVWDKANEPELMLGDSVIVDPDRKPKPDDFVLVLSNGEPAIRRLNRNEDHDELEPVNRRWPKITTSNLSDILLGTITESSRKRT